MAWPYAVILRNLTQKHLEAYPVVVDPPPPHRERVAALDVPGLGERALDPNGFNPVYYTQGVQNPDKPNGIFLGFALEFPPRAIQYRIFHHVVPPGQEGVDPDLQPTMLGEGFVTVTWSADTLVEVDRPDRVAIRPA